MIPNATCASEDCSEPTPWDMACIVFDGRAFCSPACAREALDRLERVPETITLHDPQYAVDRDELPGVAPEDVDITRGVTGLEDARQAIEECATMHPYEFRASPEDEVTVDYTSNQK